MESGGGASGGERGNVAVDGEICLWVVANLLAWDVRDYTRGPWSRIENLIFYIIMFLSTSGAKKLHQHRDQWHSGWWTVKISLCIILSIVTFLLPSTIIELYGVVAHFGAGVFLLIQLHHLAE